MLPRSNATSQSSRRFAGADEAAAVPKVKADPTAVPRICVGNSSVL